MLKKLLTRKQYDSWIKNMPAGTCTFCDWKDTQVVLKEFDNWVWIANISPYWWWHTLIMSKRHFVEFDDMTFKEASELPTVLAFTKKKFIDAKLVLANGKVADRYVYFWRMRVDWRDTETGAIKPDHFHLHLAPDIDHSWDPILNKDAYKCDVIGKLGEKE